MIILCEEARWIASGLALYLVLRRAQRACCLRSGQQKLPAVFDRVRQLALPAPTQTLTSGIPANLECG